MSDPSSQPVLILNPLDDEEFARTATTILDRGAMTPERMQDLLRERYRRAVVRRREIAGERTAIWYVYRDGRWVRRGVTGTDDGRLPR